MTVGLVAQRSVDRAKSFARSSDAIAITEYGMLIALMALALIAVLAVFGGSISTWFASKTSQITTN
jgi:Flp pilus assembly pilin Flp